ncbi:WbqC family protein [Nitrospira sp. KM1]|uniref:WbqC family protein n=1 Tax=Nitrospira sp. KM1 TaxID=1936990 RepID=UPI0015634F39|nr:WbqC family protein [Nitrospira sp. KM1]
MKGDGVTLCVLQPGYLPWLGFFDQMRRSDVFVLYDDVQYDKHGWRNRNRIKSPQGPHWLTVPVRHKGLGWPRINEIEIDNQAPWAKKHLGTIRQFYARAPFVQQYLPMLEALLLQPWARLIELDVAVIALMSRWLGLERPLVRSSSLGIEGGQSERLERLCRHFGATRYLSGDSAKEYLDLDLFARSHIDVEWQSFQHPEYVQQHGPFVPCLSALDLVLNCGPASYDILARTCAQEGA